MKCDDPEVSVLPLCRKPTSKELRAMGEKRPPSGWLIAYIFTKPVTDLRDIGIWTILMDHVQQHWNRHHRIVRLDDRRVCLMVPPEAREYFDALLIDISNAIEQCNCGGSECLAGRVQADAARILTKRWWRTAPLAAKMDVMAEEEFGIKLALRDETILDDPELACAVAWRIFDVGPPTH